MSRDRETKVNPVRCEFLKNYKIIGQIFGRLFFSSYLCTAIERIAQPNGALAQLVEHRTENPCVPGSIPGGTTPPFITNPVKVFGLERDFLCYYVAFSCRKRNYLRTFAKVF